jgi:hypothetical protein
MKAHDIFAAEGDKLYGDDDALDNLRFVGPDVVSQVRPYIAAADELILKQLIPLGTLDSLTEALCRLRVILVVDRRNITAFENIMPFIMLRLDRDRECNVFITQWFISDQNIRLHPTYTASHYLNPYDVEMLSHTGVLHKDRDPLSRELAIMLLSLKQLVDIRNLKVTRKVLAQRYIAFDIGEIIEPNVLRSSLSSAILRATPEALGRFEKQLIQSARMAGKFLATNGDFMTSLFDPDRALSSTPKRYAYGSWEEAAMVIQPSYAALWETEGVLDLLEDARTCAARDMEWHDMILGGDDHPKHEIHLKQAARERQCDFSMWEFLEDAFSNACFLGPWHERPSERHTWGMGAEWKKRYPSEEM